MDAGAGCGDTGAVPARPTPLASTPPDRQVAPAPEGPIVGEGWRAPAALGGAALVGTAVVVAVDPTTTHVPLCPLAFATGLDCPLCGSLRAVYSLATGDPVAALDHNALVTVAIPFAVVAWVLWLLRALGRLVLATRRWPRRSGVVVAVVALVFFVARNLPALAWLGSGASGT